MPEDKKNANIEISGLEREKNEKDHFLEETFETEINPEKVYEKKNENSIRPFEKEGVSSDELGRGNIIAQGIYIQEQEKRKKEIEKVLEKDLGEIYISLPEDKKRDFRTVGEQTAMQINGLFNQGKIKIKKIIYLIKKWLALIPGINKYFLEQEAKIKADEIMKINKD